MTREGPDGERSHPMITRRSALTATAGGLLFFFSDTNAYNLTDAGTNSTR
jgi:hypothetical protein